MPPFFANLRTTAAAGNLRHNPFCLFLLLFTCAAGKLSRFGAL